ncbi:MAG: FAD-dependent oxidoreductase [Chloroflexota bacterium]|nr:MAG: FAD-dependent oxidoreductase [Chloroflexota bacterium]
MTHRRPAAFDLEVDVLVVGAGGCGLIAALAAAEKGVDVLVVEKFPRPSGNTALSQGMVLAGGTRFQRDAGLTEATADNLAQDIFGKNHHQSSPMLTYALARSSASLVEWMVDSLQVDLRLVTDFKYPGFTQYWVHCPPSRSGAELVDYLVKAVRRQPRIQLVTNARAVDLIEDNGAVVGAIVETTGTEAIGAKKVILAANGFGGNREMVQQYVPEIATALYFGHEGNTGEAILWGQQLGASLDCMSAYQGHATVASPHGILITWATIVNGGFLVNREGRRFGNDGMGYSEYAREVLKQSEALAHVVMDQRIYDSVLSFEDFRQCIQNGVFRQCGTIEDLARALHVDPDGLAEELSTYNATSKGLAADRFGRHITRPLEPPFFGATVTAALFHTQGGLRVDPHGRVLRPDDTPIPNLYAGGGSAVGVSGNGCDGYLAGNGLLAALGFGKLTGDHAGLSVRSGE